MKRIKADVLPNGKYLWGYMKDFKTKNHDILVVINDNVTVYSGDGCQKHDTINRGWDIVKDAHIYKLSIKSYYESI